MNSLRPDDLVLHAGTCQHRSFIELCDTAVAGGFQAVTIYATQYRGARQSGLSDTDLRQVLNDRGLVVADLDCVLDWIPGEEAPPEFRGAEDLFYRVFDALGGTTMNVATMAPTVDVDAAAAGFAAVCERAAERGIVVTLEYLPWSGIPDAATALQIVESADCANGTLMFDVWHTYRGPSTDAQIAAVPGERWGAIQLNDAPATAQPNVVHETLNARLLPGEGDAPVLAWLRTLRAAGCQAPVGVEVFSSELDALTPAEAGTRLGEATRAVMEASQ